MVGMPLGVDRRAEGLAWRTRVRHLLSSGGTFRELGFSVRSRGRCQKNRFLL